MNKYFYSSTTIFLYIVSIEMSNWNILEFNNQGRVKNIDPISNNIKENDSEEVKNVKERIYYARLAFAKANTKEKTERIGKELDELLARLADLQKQKGGKRKTMRRKSKKSRKARKHTRKH